MLFFFLSYCVFQRERERGGGEREIKLYFSTVKILALRPTYISVVATHYC